MLFCRVLFIPHRNLYRNEVRSVGSAERRKEIMKILCRRGHETITKLADEFGVSIRTIQRDIDVLSLYEPIYTKNGRYQGGVYIMKGYDPDKQYFACEDTELLESIVAQSEKTGCCRLNREQLSKLKKIISNYSKPKIS